MRRRFVVAAALCLALPTSAYVLTGDDWTYMGAPISEPFLVNADSFPGSAGATVDVNDRLHDALDAWAIEGGADFAYTSGGTTTDFSWPDGTDNKNVLQYVASTTHPTAVALAQTWVAPPNDVVDCDIRFYGANGTGPVDWGSDDLGVGPAEMDLERIAIHELGHCLGLNHSAVNGSIMFPTSPPGTPVSERTLHADDIAGLQAIYGLPGSAIVYVTHRNNDDGSGSSVGDGDGIVERNETIELSVDAENAGPGMALAVEVTLSSPAFDVLVLTPTQSIGDIASGAIETHSTPMLYSVRSGCSTNRAVTMELLFEDSEGNAWTDSYSQELVCDVDDDLDGFAESVDCDDSDPLTYPGAPEVWYDGVDQNCDTLSDFDQDGDGQDRESDGGTDCDDDDPGIRLGAQELCDGVDQDCDSKIDEGWSPDGTIFYKDTDGDGYGNLPEGLRLCVAPFGYVEDGTDCDDTDASVKPGVNEFCDGRDTNCNGAVDDGWAPNGTLFYDDDDGDGFGDPYVSARWCHPPPGFVDNKADCDDSTAAVLDGADYYRDADGDGFGDTSSTVRRCVQPWGHVADGTDCDDGQSTVHPGATEACNGVDDNCDAVVPAAELDTDGDGSSTCAGDCDDGNDARVPGAVEVCDGLDNDCDGAVPGAESDGDLDGVMGCEGDCDDEDPLTLPGATEFCDGVDNDCDLSTDEEAVSVTWYADADGDGAGDPSATTESCSPVPDHVLNGDDCDDGDADVISTATWYRDDDGDGYGEDSATMGSCTAPSGYVRTGGDCDDSDAEVNPDSAERCDGQDTNCNGVVDDGGADATWYADADQDGYGDPDDSITGCGDDATRVENGDDCDDDEPLANPGLTEVPYDGIDNDCVDGDLCDGDLDGFDAMSCGGADCDDGNDTVYPGAPEYLDNRDNDCDGLVDNQGGDTDNVQPTVGGSRCSCDSRTGPLGGWPMLLSLLALRRRRTTEANRRAS